MSTVVTPMSDSRALAPLVGLATHEPLLERLHQIEGEENAMFIARAHEIRTITLSLMAKSPVFLLAPYGRAKTDLLVSFGNRVAIPDDVTVAGVPVSPFFEASCYGTMIPEDIFGSLDYPALRGDPVRQIPSVYRHDIEEMATTSLIVLVDEVWRSAEGLRDSQLGFMLKHRLRLGKERINPVPLWLYACAANSGPPTAADGPFYDRLISRLHVEGLGDEDFGDLIDGVGSGTLRASSHTVMGYHEMVALQQFITTPGAIRFPRRIADTYIDLRKEMATKQLYCSDRRWAMSTVMVKAHAVYRGADTVAEADLRVLDDILWDLPEQRDQVRVIVTKIATPQEAELIALGESVEREYKQALKLHREKTEGADKEPDTGKKMGLQNEATNALMDGLTAFDDAITKLDGMKVAARTAGRPIDNLLRLVATIEGWQSDLSARMIVRRAAQRTP